MFCLLFADYTAREYFERTRASRFPDAQASITKVCLAYLSFDTFQRGYCLNDTELESLLEDNALLRYAARHWGDHAREQGLMDETCKALVVMFLQNVQKVACQVLLLDSYPRYPNYSRSFPRHFSDMHISAFFGLDEIIRCQLQNGAKCDMRDSYGRTPLSIASENGRLAVVKILLARDNVDVNSTDMDGRTSLSFAAAKGDEAVVRLLLTQHHVDVNPEDAKGRTPLSLAAAAGSEEVVRLLLKRDDINVNLKDTKGRTPLSWAAEAGSEEVVRLLLGRCDIDVNSTDAGGQTALLLAVAREHEAVVKLLLAHTDHGTKLE
jgi:hypothetical protein